MNQPTNNLKASSNRPLALTRPSSLRDSIVISHRRLRKHGFLVLAQLAIFMYCIIRRKKGLFMWSLRYPIDLTKASSLDKNSRAVLTGLPEYGFNHSQRYQSEDRVGTDMRFRLHSPHELLGTWIPSSKTLEARWHGFLDVERLPWVNDHHVSIYFSVIRRHSS